MSNYKIEFKNLTKIFGRRLVFAGINKTFVSPNIYGIAGSNGSGKSTISKLIAGVVSPTKGKIVHSINNKTILSEELHKYVGFVSPYLVLYDEFSAEENLIHFARIRGITFEEDYISFLFNRFGLYHRRKDPVKAYSSGMKQRLKFIFALQHKPSLILLDEPTSNLDNKGKDIVYRTIEEQGRKNLVIIASNEDADLNLCKETINVEDYKNIKKEK